MKKFDPIKMGQNSIMFDPCVTTRNEKIVVHERSRIDAFCKLEGGAGLTIGSDVHVASFCHVNIGGGETILADGSSMGSGAKTVSGGNQPDSITCSAVAPSDQQVLGHGTVILERNACLYAGAVVYAGPGQVVSIGEGSRVGALSFVTKSIPAGELWAGVPARFIRKVEP
jgi:acetyltransferase-like isoleucine patch superfamily enzyme